MRNLARGMLVATSICAPAWAGQVPNPLNAPPAVASGDALTATSNAQQAADSGINLSSTPQGRFLAGPCSGSGAPTFRLLCAADVTAGLGYTPVNKAGDAMTGPLTINLNTDSFTPPASGGLEIFAPDGVAAASALYAYGAQSTFSAYRADGTAASPAALGANEVIGGPGGLGYNGSSYVQGCGLAYVTLDAFTSSDNAEGLRLFCTGRNQTTARSAGLWDQDGFCVGPNTFSGANPCRAVLDVETSATTLTTSDTATLGSASATGTITVSTIPATWPTSGVAQVDGELIYYTELTTTSLSITNRGYYGSAGAPHSCGSTCTIDFAMAMVAKNTSTLPYLSVMSNGSVAAGAIPAAPTTPVFSTGLPIVPKQTTVASLPTCAASAKGELMEVTDASSPTWHGTLTGGGAAFSGAMCNGSSWVAF